jgi:hypothetical protein
MRHVRITQFVTEELNQVLFVHFLPRLLFLSSRELREKDDLANFAFLASANRDLTDPALFSAMRSGSQ